MVRIHGDEFAGPGSIFTPEDGAVQHVKSERIRQDKIYGWEHDSKHTDEDWAAIIQERLEKLQEAQAEAQRSGIPYPVTRRAIELAAVSSAYLEHLTAKSLGISGPVRLI